MTKRSAALMLVIILATIILVRCSENKSPADTSATDSTMAKAMAYGGYESNAKWGEHLVLSIGCNDCHTPKKMTAQGPANNDSLALSGHWSIMPLPDIDTKMIQKKGLAVTSDETAWIGPWGISYAANLTPDSTGIGSWTEEQFIRCIREGKYMGIETERSLLPPMPWPSFRNLSDDELKAIFSYLKSIKPIHNIVPQATPPVMN